MVPVVAAIAPAVTAKAADVMAVATQVVGVTVAVAKADVMAAAVAVGAKISCPSGSHKPFVSSSQLLPHSCWHSALP